LSYCIGEGAKEMPRWGKKSVTAAAIAAVVLGYTAFQWITPAGQSATYAELGTLAADELDFLSIREDGYDHYIAKYSEAIRPDTELVIEAETFIHSEGAVSVVENYAGASGASVQTDETGALTWEIEVASEGLYNLAIHYFPIEGKSSSIEREFKIDGVIPFQEAGRLVFPRMWTNELEEVEQDNRGNDLRPRQVEAPQWQEAVFKDSEGYYLKPFLFYFTKGKHTITLVSTREPMIIDYIKLYQEEEIPSYEEVAKQYEQQGIKPASGVMVKVQAEDAVLKSAPTLYPISDRASAATEPYHVSKIRMNTIGGMNWRMPGQWITWEVEVPEDGLYKIAFKNRQNYLRGMYATRQLKIDGKTPFREVEAIPFHYGGDWQMKILGEDEPYLFYLTAGTHEIQLEVTLGGLSQLIRKVEASVLELNAAYRKILMITGSTPDPFRDYELDKQLPGVIETFRRQSELLYAIADDMAAVSGERGSQAAILTTTAYQLQDLVNRPDSIPQRLDQFKTNVGGLGTWILNVREQPLELDYLIVASPDEPLPNAEASFFRNVSHEIGSFVSSFFEDYNTIGNVSDERQSVTVWIGTGRDQAQVMKSLIDDTFTPLTNIEVNLKLVQPSVLLPATLAGQGPDVAMQVGNEIPVNYAMRNAVEDLTAYPGYEEAAARFQDSAIVPYRYGDGVYALPEQQVFNMLFYRKDILEQLGLEVPQTWDDLYNMIPELQKHHLEFALPIPVQGASGQVSLVPNQAFAMLLYQRDGEFYTENGERSLLDSDVSMAAFKTWTDFYTNYKLPLQFDLANRFRTGEIPIGITDYSFYNMLTVFAPEIRGLWEFVPVPGTIREDGTIRRDVASSGTAVIMMKNAKNKDAAWEFMKWWTSKDTQVRFGREMEGLMGAAARYPTANIEALRELPWPVQDYMRLEEQWEWVRGIPEVPGGYITGRHLENAFREVVNNGTNTREALSEYVDIVNNEIRMKRREFNLSD